VSARIWSLSPDDLGTLWDECRRCFYLAAGAGFPRPLAASAAAQGVERRLVSGLGGRRTETVAVGMPAGVVEHAHRSVQSEPISVQVPDQWLRCHIRGALDLLLALDDKTLGVVEVAMEASTAGARSRRLHAWAHALESAGAGKVTALGVLLFEPRSPRAPEAPAVVPGSWGWEPIERDDSAFYGFLAEALSLLEQPTPPGGTPLCPWCVYRDASRRTGY
jgi:hypothetical protein